MSKNKKNKSLVLDVTAETRQAYGATIRAFYDCPRTYKNAEGEEIHEDRVYIDIETPASKQQHVRRKARDEEITQYGKAYEKYLKAKETGGVVDTSAQLAEKNAEIDELRKQLAITQNEDKKLLEAEMKKAAANK
jgi:hypothetical protein